MKINALALVIGKQFVERAYPGGTQGFLGDQIIENVDSHSLQLDDELLVVSDPDQERLTATYARLRALTNSDSDTNSSCVLVDPVEGPQAPCDWLTCSLASDGSASVTFVAAQPPIQPNLFQLSESNGLVTWLDLETGRQHTSASVAAPIDMTPTTGSRTALLDTAEQAIAGRGWNSVRDDESGIITFGLNAGPLLTFDLLCFVSDRADMIRLVTRLPGRTEEHRMAAVAQFLAGANWGLDVGSFDLDYRDGEVIYRAAVIAPDGTTSAKAVEMAIDCSMRTVIHYAPGLVEVAGGADAREVLARMEGREEE